MESTMMLRIGIVQAGRIVEERLIAPSTDVTIGQSRRNTFAVPGSQTLPRTLTLFVHTRDGWVLHVAPGCDARVADGEGARAVEDPRVLLGDRARGKLLLGDVTVLFQLVDAPAHAPRPQLPPSVRASLLSQIDRALVAILAISFVAHFGFAIWLGQLDWPRASIEDVPEHVVVWQPVRLAPMVAAPERPAPPSPSPSRPSPSPSHPSRPGPRAPSPAPGPTRAQLTDAVRSMGLSKLLTHRGDDGVSFVDDVIKRGDVPVDLDRVLPTISSMGVASSGDGLGHPRASSRASGPVRGGELRALSIGDVDTGRRGGEVVIETPSGPLDQTLDPEGAAPDLSRIVKEVKLRLGAIRTCYEGVMRHAEGLSGRLVIRFQVTRDGVVSHTSIEEDTLHSPPMVSCVQSRVGRWRFPESAAAFSFSFPFIFTGERHQY
jgi:hypothetical protein